MNLFLNPSVKELSKLIESTESTKPHNIVVDYDGEVLIDPELKQPELDLSKFMYRLRIRTPKSIIRQGSNWMQNLLNNLLTAWNENHSFA